METIAVIDFETTGMSPRMGARATEIAVALVQGERIVDRYQSLMRTGAFVPSFIERLTGISNRMLDDAPPAAKVMREAAAFIGNHPMVAHNAAFDRSFWHSELAQAGAAGDDEAGTASFACTLLLSRRLNDEAPNHRLGTLAEWFDLPREGRAHRALADAEVTAHLLLRMRRDVERRFADQLPDDGVTHGLLAAMQRAPRKALAKCVAQYRKSALPDEPGREDVCPGDVR
ncbi:3'-5' exonuclease [Piscinibacter sp.]|uniref:3'-5' exonuclease n=1 Tax=Piscinibacter sp. TaxID=1903157 RepID=UPI002C89AA79|nr:3'-5' exonuclease [Albitalea sp.]HUG24721.1 3'-5' exonuclease [Albitalea sp.]